ncbi:MAG: hypothetical protein KatS3mg126_0995 [Lysobacteraceae bacterium]|nr:MAG: hypothetical protein KatS3mg126_0995 [Xanthomonadaceae bacterium]
MSELRTAAREVLCLADPARKQEAVLELTARRAAAALPVDPYLRLAPVDAPGRPPRPRLVPQRALPQRGLGRPEGRAAFLHAIAHIEFNAINLALDAMARFADMPHAYYLDWLGVAADEARHFGMLVERLAALGHAYGDFDAHDGLWDMARKTADSCLARMALVPRVLEARGLDVTPAMIHRLRAAGDEASAAVLEVILAEEVGHVAVGSRWFRWLCEREGRAPLATFIGLVRAHARGAVRGPFNHEARRRAGFRDEELEALEGEARGAFG